ncbi:MAG: NlpC/P60 family protein [Alteraurantiacibacter sp.]
MNEALAFAYAAQDMIGTPFRLRGRSPNGVDCIGLVCLSLARIGRPPPTLPQYSMRNLGRKRFAGLIDATGLRLAEGASCPGDLILLRPSAAQYHLAIIGPVAQLIHAHAGLGRVVASQAPLPWPIEARWRLDET